MNIENNVLSRVQELLLEDGVVLGEAQWDALSRFSLLLRENNARFGLMSRSDVESLEFIHWPDALSLCGWAARFGGGTIVDIGSGGGIPGLLLAMTFPDREVWLVERSEKKSAFLRLAVASLGLSSVVIETAEFPRCKLPSQVGVVTARAVERPERFGPKLLRWLPEGSLYLCQSPVVVSSALEGFHVELVHDRWTTCGFRRGSLWLIQRAPTDNGA